MSSVTGMLSTPLAIAALVLPTTRLQRVLIFFIALLSGWHAYTLQLRKPGPMRPFDYTEATNITSGVLLIVDVLLMTKDPRSSIRRTLRHRVKSASPKEEGRLALEGTALVDLPLKQRLIRAGSIVCNPRCIGTNVQVANIIPLSPELATSRSAFLRQRLFEGITGELRLAAIYVLVTRVPFIKSAFTSETPTPLQRAIFSTIGLPAVYFLLNPVHCLVSFVVVGLGISDPEDWPQLFGNFSDAYTLRRAWGRSWHQLIRKPVTSVGKGLAHAVGARPGSLASRYIQLYTAFALSAWLHMPGDFVLYTDKLPPNASMWDKFTIRALFTPQFFMLQAVAITVEDAVIALAERYLATARVEVGGKGEKKKLKFVYSPTVATLGKVIGYTWVFVFLCATHPDYSRRTLANMM